MNDYWHRKMVYGFYAIFLECGAMTYKDSLAHNEINWRWKIDGQGSRFTCTYAQCRFLDEYGVSKWTGYNGTYT